MADPIRILGIALPFEENGPGDRVVRSHDDVFSLVRAQFHRSGGVSVMVQERRPVRPGRAEHVSINLSVLAEDIGGAEIMLRHELRDVPRLADLVAEAARGAA